MRRATGLGDCSNKKKTTQAGQQHLNTIIPFPLLHFLMYPNRWGHSGYRELYAEDFASSEDNDSEEEEEVRRPKPRGSENGSSSVKKKRKKEVSSVGSSKRKRKRGLSESTEDEEERKSRKKKRKLKVDKRGVKRKDGRKKSKHKHSQS